MAAPGSQLTILQRLLLEIFWYRGKPNRNQQSNYQINVQASEKVFFSQVFLSYMVGFVYMIQKWYKMRIHHHFEKDKPGNLRI